jgi:hypothetical protein
MKFDTSTWMMIAFVVAMILSGWKMYPFLVNRTLEDDDTGEDSHEYLVAHMHKVLQETPEVPTVQELHTTMTQHQDFNKEKYWRFNQNKLQQLLYKHYAKHPHLGSIGDIHKELH